jgi:hypothetical protein
MTELSVRVKAVGLFTSLISLQHGPHRKHSLCCWYMLTESLHSNGRGEDSIENQSHDSYLASPLERWLLPSNEL